MESTQSLVWRLELFFCEQTSAASIFVNGSGSADTEHVGRTIKKEIISKSIKETVQKVLEMEADDTRDMGPLMQREKGFKNQSNISCNWLLGGMEPSGL